MGDKRLRLRIIIIALIGFYNVNLGYGQSKSNWVQADFEFFNKNYEQAVDYFSLCIKSNDDKYKAYYNRALCYYNLKNYKQAKVSVKKALKIPKSEKRYSEIRGNSYWLYALIESPITNTSKALRLMKKSTRYKKSSLIYSTLGYKEIDLGKYDDAIESLNYSIELNSRNAWAYSNRAWAYLMKNKLDLARNDINISIRLDDKNPYAYKHSAMIYIALQDYDSACIELNKAKVLVCSDKMVDKGSKEIDELIKKYCCSLESK